MQIFLGDYLEQLSTTAISLSPCGFIDYIDYMRRLYMNKGLF